MLYHLAITFQLFRLSGRQHQACFCTSLSFLGKNLLSLCSQRSPSHFPVWKYLFWVTKKKVHCIPYLFYASMLKIITLRPGNPKQNQGVLSWVQGAGCHGVPERGRHQKHGVLIFHWAAKRVAWGEGKDWHMPSFLSFHGMSPGTGLQETAFVNPKLFWSKFGNNFLATVTWGNPISGSRAVRARPVGFSAQQTHFSFLCSAEATQSCSNNTSWVQLAQKKQRNWLQVQRCPRWSCHLPPAARTAL